MKLKELLDEYGEYEIKDVAKIEALIEKPKPKTVWDLKDDDEYFYIGSDGDVYENVWGHYYFDVDSRKQGNIFLTEEEVEYEANRREVYTIVKNHSYDFSREEWEDRNIKKWRTYYGYEYEKIMYVYDIKCRYAGLYFKSKEDIQSAIDEVGKADFIKYYLGVKDYVE